MSPTDTDGIAKIIRETIDEAPAEERDVTKSIMWEVEKYAGKLANLDIITHTTVVSILSQLLNARQVQWKQQQDAERQRQAKFGMGVQVGAA